MRKGVSLQVYLEGVSCVPSVIIEGCTVQVEERKGRVIFFKEKCKESNWPGYGEPKMQLGEVNVFC